VGTNGTSSSYVLKPALFCDDVAVAPVPDGGGRSQFCGNAWLEEYEQCDDGNQVSGDGCSASCLLEVVVEPEPEEPELPEEPEIPEEPELPELPEEPSQPVCGNLLLEFPEQCDDGNEVSGDGCSDLCLEEPIVPEEPVVPEVPSVPELPVVPRPSAPVPPYVPGAIVSVCGNGLVELGEQCDDGNSNNTDFCDTSCRRHFPAPSTPEGESLTGLVYLTNDTTVLFFEQFPGDETEYDIVLQDSKRSYDLGVKKADFGYFSLLAEEELLDGFYQITVRDKKNRLRVQRMVLEVRVKEEIEPPFLSEFDGLDLQWGQEGLHLTSDQPILHGRTILPATLGLYSSQLQKTFIVYTDSENGFVFQYPEPLLKDVPETLQVVAHYENGYVSRETLLAFTVHEFKMASDHVESFQNSSWIHVLALFLLFMISTLLSLGFIGYFGRLHDLLMFSFWSGMEYSHNRKKRAFKRLLKSIVFVMVLSSQISVAFAVTTTPNILPYEGVLKTPGGVAITTPHDFRFSIWSDSDFDAPADFDGGGNIPIAAPGFSGYQEVQTVTPDSTGYFQLNIGAISPIPDFILTDHLYLQVEVKVNGSPNTSFEVLDIDGAPNANDRQQFGTMPYARNADFIDNAELGLSDGDLVILEAGDVFPVSVIPGGTNAGIFSIDSDDTGGVIQLSFGDVLNNRILSFDPDGIALADGWFDFSDDVNIQGDLTVVGTINGQVLGPKNISLQLQPEFSGAVLADSGLGSHKGKLEFLYEDVDGPGLPENLNYYKWTTLQPTIQDKDLIVRVRLPDNFVSFQPIPLVFRYRTETANIADNEIDLILEDSTGTVIGTMSGNANLVSPVFITTDIDFGGGGVFTAGTEITIRIKMFATNIGAAYVSDLMINYIGN